ncbi:MAG: hypothetical protein AAF333_05030 [Planctomycetota bacterium]
MFRYVSVVLLVSLISSSVQAALVTEEFLDDLDNKVTNYDDGSYFFPGWSQGFSGRDYRTWQVATNAGIVKYFTTSVFETGGGGYDAGAAQNTPAGTDIRQLRSPNRLQQSLAYAYRVTLFRQNPAMLASNDEFPFSRFNLQNLAVPGDGLENIQGLPVNWWIGPKTIIADTPSFTTLDGQYECYIVDAASIPATDFVQKFIVGQNGNDGRYRGTMRIGNEKYNHYTNTFFANGDVINQVWTLRMGEYITNANGTETFVPGWRSPGGQGASTFVHQIQDEWYNRRIVPGKPVSGSTTPPPVFYNLGWKINVETSSTIHAQVDFYNLDLPKVDD